MKIIIHGPISARDHLGQMVGYAPHQEVEVDDDDETAVAWARYWAGTDFGELVDDAKVETAAAHKSEPAKQLSVPTLSEQPDDDDEQAAAE